MKKLIVLPSAICWVQRGWAAIFLVMCLIGISGAARGEAGIAVYKEQSFYSDDQAVTFVFDRMETSPEITWFYRKNQRISCGNHQFFGYVIFPPGLTVELTEQQQFEELKRHFKELDVFAKRFPKAAVILKPRLDAIQIMLEEFEAGKVLFTGKWISREEYIRLIAERDRKLKTYELERARLEELERARLEELERARLEELERARAVARDFARNCRYGVAVYVMFIVFAIFRRSKRLLVILLVIPLLAAGGLTIADGGFRWFNNAREKISLALMGS